MASPYRAPRPVREVPSLLVSLPPVPDSAGAAFPGQVGIPASAALAWWGTAWLRGLATADEVVRHVPGAGVINLLAEAQLNGASGIGLALPIEGDALGLGGPSEFNRAALHQGQAAVSDAGPAWVPVGQGWERWSSRRRPLPDVGEADRALRQELLSAADALAALDVARWNPELADAFLNLNRAADLVAPPGTPAVCVSLAERGLRAEGIAELGLSSDSSAVSASEIMARHDLLTNLDRVARRAIVAAFSPEVWPPA